MITEDELRLILNRRETARRRSRKEGGDERTRARSRSPVRIAAVQPSKLAFRPLAVKMAQEMATQTWPSHLHTSPASPITIHDDDLSTPRSPSPTVSPLPDLKTVKIQKNVCPVDQASNAPEVAPETPKPSTSREKDPLPLDEDSLDWEIAQALLPTTKTEGHIVRNTPPASPDQAYSPISPDVETLARLLESPKPTLDADHQLPVLTPQQMSLLEEVVQLSKSQQ